MARDGAMLTTLVHEEFDKIGRVGKSAFPHAEVRASIPRNVNDKDRWMNENKAAWEFWVASRLRSRANKAFEMAKGLCESMGMFDKVTNISVGSSASLWSSDLVVLNVKVNNPQKKIDVTVLCNELRKAGVSKAKIDAAVSTATFDLKPAVVHEPTLSF